MWLIERIFFNSCVEVTVWCNAPVFVFTFHTTALGSLFLSCWLSASSGFRAWVCDRKVSSLIGKSAASTPLSCMLMLEAYCSQAIGLELLLDCKFFINARSKRQSIAMCYCCWSSFYLWAAKFICELQGSFSIMLADIMLMLKDIEMGLCQTDIPWSAGRLSLLSFWCISTVVRWPIVCALSLHLSDHSIQTGSEYPCHICWECNLNSVMGLSLKDWVRQLLPDDILSSRQSGCSSKADL